VSKLLKADVERAFIYAYYQLVKGCKVSMDIPDENIIPVVAFAHKTGEIYAMDFSSTYHFADKVKPSTRVRWIRKKTEQMQRYTEFAGIQHKIEYKALYEIWCFIPPNNRVMDAVEAAAKEKLPVSLVSHDAVNDRIRQVASLKPLKDEIVYNNAFLWAARLMREAGVFSKYK